MVITHKKKKQKQPKITSAMQRTLAAKLFDHFANNFSGKKK